MYHIYQKLNITALQNCLNWCLIRDMVGQVGCFHFRLSNLHCSADHSRANLLKISLNFLADEINSPLEQPNCPPLPSTIYV